MPEEIKKINLEVDQMPIDPPPKKNKLKAVLFPLGIVVAVIIIFGGISLLAMRGVITKAK